MRSRISIRGRVRPSVGPSVRRPVGWSRVIFEDEKYAYQAHLVPCIILCRVSSCQSAEMSIFVVVILFDGSIEITMEIFLRLFGNEWIFR